MTSWLNHKALRIMKGIGKYPTDTNSAENNPVVVDLMSGVITLDTDGWSPNIPTVKNGGVWTESPTTDGRSLIAAAAGNVTEKMTLNITDKAYLSVMKALESLGFMAASCRDFWQTQDQIDPVYLMWAAGCNTPPLPQYAILYNIELVPDYLDSPNQPTMRVAMTLEREPYWRGIPPGMNPKMWTFYVNNQKLGTEKTYTDLTLATGTDHLVSQAIQNKFEWTPAAYGLQSTTISQNYIDIPKALVPGDAPPLAEWSLNSDNNFTTGVVYAALSSRPLSGTGHDGVLRRQSYVLNMGDFSAGVATKVNSGASGLGVRSNNSAVNFYNATRTVTGIDANYVTFAQWGGSIANGIKLDRHLMRGTFAVFVRARNASVTGVIGDMKMRLIVEEIEDAANQFLTVFTGGDVSVPVFPAATGARWPIAYLGMVTIPFNNRGVQSPLGYGTQLQEANNNLRITLQQQVLTATANRIMEAVDLIFMPVDESMVQIVLPIPSGVSFPAPVVILDNTGYLQKGALEQSAICYGTNANSGGISAEFRGSNFYLAPGVDQRIHFLVDYFSFPGTSETESVLTATLTVRLNIVPRWSSIRDS